MRWSFAVVAVAMVAALAAVPLATRPAAAATHGRMTPADLGLSGAPQYVQTTGPDGTGTFSCQGPASATNEIPCFSPSQIRAAYDVPGYLNGAGQTIVIVDAFGDPYIASDLALFDSTFGLPAAKLNITCIAAGSPTVGTCPTFDPTNADEGSWAGEIALDTQWSHAIAPGATIDLVLAQSDQDADILAAQQYVVNHNLGSVLSQSFGENELCFQSETSIFNATQKVFEQALAQGISVFASSGDTGSATFNCAGTGFVEGVNEPASEPLVTSVGGTHLNANYTTGQYYGETVWNNSNDALIFGAGGGGFSSIFSKPLYQWFANTGSAYRGVPDVTYNADVYNGVLGVCSACNGGTPGFFIFGGTSAGSPQWAAITALADQAAGHRLGFLNPTLYAIAASPLYQFAMHDVTVGNNALPVTGVTAGYSAGPGWDAASGLGSPNVAVLTALLSKI